jgi:iron complex outermembrane receptor protein
MRSGEDNKMRKSRIRTVLLLVTSGLTSFAVGYAPAQAQTSTAPAAKPSGNQIEEILVTARRREERSQDVPIAITTFSPARLQQQGIKGAQDLQGTVPSLIVGQNGQGVRDASTFTLRGQGTTFEGSSGVATYLNEVPLPTPITLSNQGGPGNFLDLANMQVLAGPQGTLFGRNTTGGAVLLVPNKPTDKFEGYVQGTYGTYDDREIEAVINVPIVPDVLKIRFAGQTKDRHGYTHDYYWNVDRDDEHYKTGRLGIDFSPTSTIDNYTMLYGTRSHNKGPGTINEGFNLPALVATNAYEYTVGLPQYGVPPGVIGCDPSAAGTNGPIGCNTAANYYGNLADQAKKYGPRGTALDVNEFDYIRTWGVTNTTKFQVTPNTAIRNIASYTRFKDGYSLDADGSPAPQYDTGYNGYGGNPSSRDFPRDDFRVITEELQLQGTALDNKVTYTIGGFYFEQKTIGPQTGIAVDSCAFNLVAYSQPPISPTPQNPQTYCSPFINSFTQTNRSKALYAQATYGLGGLSSALENLKLTAGFRYTWDHIFGDSSYNGGFTGNLKSSAPTWTVGLDWKASRNLLFYGKVSRGYKAGGINTYAVFDQTETFGPEYNTTYEIGMKSDSHVDDMPLRFNIALYRTDYSKIQRASGDTNPSGISGAAILSSASAIIQGVELDATIKPTPRLELGGNYSYTDAYYKKFPYTPHQSYFGYFDCDGKEWLAESSLNLTCRPLQYIAKNIFSVHASYDLPVDPSVGKVTAFVSYTYQGPQHTEALFAPSQQPFEKLSAYGLVNLSLDIHRIAGSPISAGMFVTNLTNKLYRTSNSDTYQSQLVQSTLYGEPRMVGGRLKVEW